MAQARTTVPPDDPDCSLTCECWDCRSYRRHLLRLWAALLLACGLGGEVAWLWGWWRGGAAAPAAEVELAGAPPATAL